MIILSGETMGSTWHIHIAETLDSQQIEELQKKIESVLDDVNQHFSPFIAQSELSQFNDSSSTFPIKISQSMREVVTQALWLCEQTQGVYDITVEPLVNIWGFGKKEVSHHPEAEQVAQALRFVNYQNLQLSDQGLRKQFPQTRIDLCSIAKGYGVDKVAQVVEATGVKHYLVDIGGELRISGNRYQQEWRVGIERPQWGGGAYEQILTFKDVDIGVATSGNYRNYFKDKGKVASHEINTKTGYTNVSKLLSVTVLAENCMLADGYATALFLLGDRAFKFADKHQIAALFLVYDVNQPQSYTLQMSSAFQEFMQNKR